MAATDILFVFPPAPGTTGAFKNHLGVAYLRAALAKEGIATAQYLNDSPSTVNEVATDIVKLGSPVVGFTVYDANARLSIAIAQSIKRQKSSVYTVFGGPTATFNARPLLERHAAIDACVMGETEETGPQIFGKLLTAGSFHDIQEGVAFHRGREIVCTALPPLVGSGGPRGSATLDSTPSPYLSGILADGQEGVLTSRGCTHHCQYCCFAALGGRRLRLHSIERVLAELEYIAEHQKRKRKHHPVALLDDTFTLIPERAKALCLAIINSKLKINLSCSTRADTVDEELLRLMRAAGFTSIAFGLESAVPSVLRAIGKVRPPDWRDPDLTPERQFLQRLRTSVVTAKKYGFIVGVSIILGLPTETHADAAETLRFVKELPADSYAHNFLWVFAGTPLWTTHDKYGITCSVDNTGLPTTTGYSYNVKKPAPSPTCELEHEADLSRLLSTDALYGCNATLAKTRGIGSVIINAGELSVDITEWLRGILRIGGIIVQVYPNRNEPWPTLYRDRSCLADHLVPAQRYIQVQRKQLRNNGDQIWEIAGTGIDLYRTCNPALLQIRTSRSASPLITWMKGGDSKASVCEILGLLREPSELVDLMNRIERGKIPRSLQRMTIPPYLRYPGRWLRGKAPCSSITRLEISDRAEVRCCRQSEPIGQVGDSLEVMSRRLNRLIKIAEQRRGCEQCRNGHCPRCPFPGIDDEIYCQIMTKQERALQALNWIWLYSRIPLLMALQRIS